MQSMSALMTFASILCVCWRGEALVAGVAKATGEFMARSAPEECGPEPTQGLQDVVGVWMKHFPSSPVEFLDGTGNVCLLEDGTTPSRLTVLQAKDDRICDSHPAKPELALLRKTNLTSDPFTVAEFPVTSEMPGGEGERNYVMAWPTVRKCTEQDPCPLVVHFHGSGEPGWDVGMLKSWGFFNYLVSDESCRNTLGSVLLFPQLGAEEDWFDNGREVIEHFIQPLIMQTLRDSPNIDQDNIAVVGYSSGAFAACLAATMYPSLFTILAAGSAAGPGSVFQGEQEEIFKSTPIIADAQRRLKLAVFAWTEGDLFIVPKFMDLIWGMLHQSSILDGATVNVRYYGQDVKHMEASEAMFNHWPYLHDVLWEGHVDSKFI